MNIPNRLLETWSLKDAYDYILDSILFNAQELGLKPVYRYENASDRELPMGFETRDPENGIGIQCRHTTLGQLLEIGTHEQLIGLLKKDDLGNYKVTELLKEMFGGADEYLENKIIVNAILSAVRNAPVFERAEKDFCRELEQRTG